MKLRTLQFFFFAAGLFAQMNLILADLSNGQIYSLTFVDVDGRTLLTADGHVTVVVVTTLAQTDKARAVGDRVPDHCLGNQIYQPITVVEFKQHAAPTRALLTALVRRRLDTEGQRLQKRYDQLNITRDARLDVHAVADFDGKVAAQLDSSNSDAVFRVFVFGRNGALLKQWNDVPSAVELAAVLK